MNQEFLFLLDVVLASRLVFVFRDNPLSTRGLCLLAGIQCVGLLVYHIQIAWTVLLACLVIITVVFHLLEVRRRKTDGLRVLSLAAQAIVLSVFFSPAVHLEFNPAVCAMLSGLGTYSLLLTPWGSLRASECCSAAMGGLLVLNEVNLLIRFQLRALDLVPPPGAAPAQGGVDGKEYATGRVIGILERILIFAAVLGNQIAAIGIVLAAKGFIRFKEMDDRPFAEYVLIGTLMSALYAVIVGLAVKSLLGQ